MPQPPIYLDHNATTPIDPGVVEAMAMAWRECGGNPASQHAAGRKARRMLEDARDRIAELLGAKTGGMEADQVIFTSGGTEANNLALLGLASIPAAGGKPASGVRRDSLPCLIISAIEHPSVLGAAEKLRRRGCTVESLSVDSDGVVIHEGTPTHHSPATSSTEGLPEPALLSVMLANNETGVIQAVSEIASICHQHGVLMHTDAVQAVGKIPVNFRQLGVDAMTVAPHKFHGPLGIGALIVRHGVKIQPQLFGGFQQSGLRPGTENVALAVGFHKALELAISELSDRAARMRSLRDELERQLLAELPETVIIGQHAPRLPNTSNVSVPGINRQALVMALDIEGVACSTGSACASGSSEPSPTLVAMGLPRDVIEGSIRLSLGAFTTAEEAHQAARRIIKTVKHLQSNK